MLCLQSINASYSRWTRLSEESKSVRWNSWERIRRIRMVILPRKKCLDRSSLLRSKRRRLLTQLEPANSNSRSVMNLLMSSKKSRTINLSFASRRSASCLRSSTRLLILDLSSTSVTSWTSTNSTSSWAAISSTRMMVMSVNLSSRSSQWPSTQPNASPTLSFSRESQLQRRITRLPGWISSPALAMITCPRATTSHWPLQRVDNFEWAKPPNRRLVGKSLKSNEDCLAPLWQSESPLLSLTKN